MAGRAVARPISVQVEGATELRRALRQAGASATDFRDVGRSISRQAVTEIRPSVPWRSGALAGSLLGTATTTKAIVQAGNARVPYAGPIHFGWATRPDPSRGWRGGPIAPNPFVYDWLDKRRDEVIQAYEDQMQKLCDRVGAST